jgi:tungstate transport system substrate-binding protein
MYLFNAYAGTGRSRRLRRLLAGGAAASLVLAAAPALASADNAAQLTVVGTSDVSDSGLMPNLIQPEFENAFPNLTFKYVGSATGAAIQSAEGTGTTAGPSVLIVHAASLENQFVAGGFSYQNKPGYAVFRNDFVLAGPNADPAGVATNAPNNIAQSFADVATAGVAGTAHFITRGGTTTASGTTVEEHTIWGLVSSANLTPTGVVLCTVSAADGGGMSPIKPTVQATSGQACPDSGTVSSTDAPAWYTVNTGASQATNVEAANSRNDYVLTDRGTYDYLNDDQLQGGATLIPNLGIDVRNNLSTAPGGANALINYFHAYIINPSAPGEAVNLGAAEDFISFLTSVGFQSQLSNYLAGTPDVSGAPFVADAAPLITASGLNKNANAGAPLTVKGTVTNAQPGYPAISGARVNVVEVEAGIPVVVAHGTTDSTGAYSIRFTPKTSGFYGVSTPQITEVADATLTPAFSDILSPGATTATAINLIGTSAPHSVLFKKVSAAKTTISVTGSISPAPALNGGKVELLATPTKGGAQKLIATVNLTKNKTSFTVKGKVKAAGSYILQLYYVQKGQTWTYSRARTVTVK